MAKGIVSPTIVRSNIGPRPRTGHRHVLAISKALNGRRDDLLFHAHSTLLASVRIEAADGQSRMINTLFVKGLCGRFDSMAYQRGRFCEFGRWRQPS